MVLPMTGKESFLEFVLSLALFCCALIMLKNLGFAVL